MHPASRWPALIMFVIGTLSTFLEPITSTHAGTIVVWTVPLLIFLACSIWLGRLNWPLIKERPRLFAASFVGGVVVCFLSYELYLVFK